VTILLHMPHGVKTKSTVPVESNLMQRICEEDLPCNIICITAPSIFISIIHPRRVRFKVQQHFYAKPSLHAYLLDPICGLCQRAFEL